MSYNQNRIELGRKGQVTYNQKSLKEPLDITVSLANGLEINIHYEDESFENWYDRILISYSKKDDVEGKYDSEEYVDFTHSFDIDKVDDVMTKCKACNDEQFLIDLFYKFKEADINCKDLSAEKIDYIKFGIVDKVDKFCDKHKMEFWEFEK